MGRRPICFGLPLKHYDYESIQNSARRHYGRHHGLFGGLVSTVAAHKLVVLVFKADDLIFNKTEFFKFKKHIFPDKGVFIKFKTGSFLFNKASDPGHNKSEQFFFLYKKHFLPDATDFAVDSKTSDPGRHTSDFDIVVFTVKHVAQYRQSG